MSANKHLQQLALLAATFLIAICGLVYELLAGTLSSYLLGDSVYQFSLVIGLFMSSMGLGAWLSRYIDKELPSNFVRLQIIIGLVGGLTAPVLFFAFSVLDAYTPLLFVLILVLGSMLGIEIPLIIRILKEHFTLKFNISNVFTADYIGALFAALLFPLVLIPQLGLLQTGFLFGLINVGVGMLALYVLRADIGRIKPLAVFSAAVFITLLAGLLYSYQFTSHMENRLYQDDIIHSQDTRYQRIVLTRRGERVRFYINGALQFDSFDEYRYHESLVHPVIASVRNPENVLILGGGDGLAVRELLKHENIKHITVVDLDPAVTKLFTNNPLLTALNNNAFKAPKVTVRNQDAWKFLENSNALYDVILIDLPDPTSTSLSRLYSTSFYKLVKQHLSQQGVVATQATSPLYAREAFWCIENTLAQTANNEEWHTLPYHVYVPSFGAWGFVMASRRKLAAEEIKLHTNRRFLSQQSLQQLFQFPPDLGKVEVDINQISTHPLLSYYRAGWEKWYD